MKRILLMVLRNLLLVYDYLGSLDSETLYSEEETLEYFRRTIEHLKQSIKEASHCD